MDLIEIYMVTSFVNYGLQKYVSYRGKCIKNVQKLFEHERNWD